MYIRGTPDSRAAKKAGKVYAPGQVIARTFGSRRQAALVSFRIIIMIPGQICSSSAIILCYLFTINAQRGSSAAEASGGTTMGSNIYEASIIRERAAVRLRKNGKSRRARRTRTVICPFTLEAVRDCEMRLRAPRSLCRFTLDVCRASLV